MKLPIVPTARHWLAKGLWVQIITTSDVAPVRWGVILHLDTRGISVLVVLTDLDPQLTYHPWVGVAEVASFTPTPRQEASFKGWLARQEASGKSDAS
jgi:hypothetical protein